MRTDSVKVTFKIPVPINKPDLNDVMYSEKAIIKACENAKNIPIIQYTSDGNVAVVGITTDVKYDKNCIIVNGISFHGGTCEQVEFDENKNVTSMEFTSFGLTL